MNDHTDRLTEMQRLTVHIEHLEGELSAAGAQRDENARQLRELIAERKLLRAELSQASQAACAAVQIDKAIGRVRALHSPWLVLDECEHDHPWSDVEAGTAHADEEIGITCNVAFVACRECCTSNGQHTEECADGHDWHYGPDGYHCRTIHTMEGHDAH